MINISKLTKADTGKWVLYEPKNEYGKIKSYNDSGVFVVYNTSGDWDNFQDYTAAHTRPEDLKMIHSMVTVKLQRPISTNGSYTNVLSYVVDKNDKLGSNVIEEEMSQEDIDTIFGDYYKVYYEARYRKNKKLELIAPTRQGDWV